MKAADAVWEVLAAALRGQALAGPLRVAVIGDLELARELADRGAAVLAASTESSKEVRRALKPARGQSPPRVSVVRAGSALPAARLDGVVWAEGSVPAGEGIARELASALHPGRRLVLIAGGPGGVGRLMAPVGRMLGGRPVVAREEHTRALLCAGLVDVQQRLLTGLRPLIVSHAARRG